MKMIVFDNFLMGNPATELLSGMATVLRGQIGLRPATLVTIEDPRLAEAVERILCAAEVEMQHLKEQELAPLDINERMQLACLAMREKTDQLAGDLDKGVWMEVEESPAAQDFAALERGLQGLREMSEATQEVVLEAAVEVIPDGFGPGRDALQVNRPFDGTESDAVPPDLISAASPEKPGRGKGPRTAKQEHICEHCREPFTARREDQAYCPKKECQKAKIAAYSRKYYAKRNGAPESPIGGADERPLCAVDGLPAPHPADPDPADQGPTEKPAPEPAKEVLLLNEPNGHGVWLIEDGARAGEQVRETRLRELLDGGALAYGTKVRHPQKGQRQVIKFRGQHSHFALRQMYGKDAYRLVELAAR